MDAVILPLVEYKLQPELHEEWERKLIDEDTEFSSVEDYFTWVGSEVLAKEVIQNEKQTYTRPTCSRTTPYEENEKKLAGCDKQCTRCENHIILHYESQSNSSDDEHEDVKSTTLNPVSCPPYESVDGFLH